MNNAMISVMFIGYTSFVGWLPLPCVCIITWVSPYVNPLFNYFFIFFFFPAPDRCQSAAAGVFLRILTHFRVYIELYQVKLLIVCKKIGIYAKILDKYKIVANTSPQQKVLFSGVFSVAGNNNSGNVIAFRLSDAQLEKKIREFREEYGTGNKGMVTWPRFCAFLGYSVEEVTECYKRGKAGKNAYNIRAEMLGRFHTECKALTNETCDKKQALARDEVKTNYLDPEAKEGGGGEMRVLFGCGDDRWIEAMK